MPSPFSPSSSHGGASPLTTKGDLFGFSTADARLPVGADGQVLTAQAAQATGLLWAAASGVGRLVQLFDSTLGADTASIDTGAGGFSTAYSHLLVLCQARTAQAVSIGAIAVTFNNDSGNNYDEQEVRGRNVTAASTVNSAVTSFAWPTPGASCAAGVFGAALTIVPNYAAVTARKSILTGVGFADEVATGGHASIRIGHWRNTAAVTRIIATGSGGNLITGTRLTVYALA